MELKEYFQILKKRWLLICIITAVAAITSAVWSYFIAKPVYSADISVIIGKVQSDSTSASNTGNPNMTYNDVMMYQKMVKTYSEFAKSRTVAENTVKALGLNIKPEALIGSISVAPKGDTEFLTITVKSRDPKQAMEVANQTAISLKEVSLAVKKTDNVQILDGAELPTGPDSPRPLLNIAIALFLGVMVSVGLVFLIEYLDSTVKTPEDIEKLLGSPVIGIIPLIAESK